MSALVFLPGDWSDPERLITITLEGKEIPQAEIFRRPNPCPSSHPR
ncbi:hypothetical protein [Streptosporangium sp. NPDC002607]